MHTEFDMVITVPATSLQPTLTDPLSNIGDYNDKYKFGDVSLHISYDVDVFA